MSLLSHMSTNLIFSFIWTLNKLDFISLTWIELNKYSNRHSFVFGVVDLLLCRSPRYLHFIYYHSRPLCPFYSCAVLLTWIGCLAAKTREYYQILTIGVVYILSISVQVVLMAGIRDVTGFIEKVFVLRHSSAISKNNLGVYTIVQ